MYKVWKVTSSQNRLICPAQESICKSAIDGDIMRLCVIDSKESEMLKRTLLGTAKSEIAVTSGDRHQWYVTVSLNGLNQSFKIIIVANVTMTTKHLLNV